MSYALKSDQLAAQRKHYQDNKESYASRRDKRRAALREIISSHKKSFPCLDCGERDPVVLDFDHRVGATKDFDIGNAPALGIGKYRLIAEIAKCDIRCSNCHRRATHARGSNPCGRANTAKLNNALVAKNIEYFGELEPINLNLRPSNPA